MYGEFNVLNNLVKEYGFTHDEVFIMSVKDVYTLIDIGKRQDYIQSKVQEGKRTMNT